MSAATHHSALGIQLPPPTSSTTSPSSMRHHYSVTQPSSQHSMSMKAETTESHHHQSVMMKAEGPDSHHPYSQSQLNPSTTGQAGMSAQSTAHYSHSRQSPVSQQPLTPQSQAPPGSQHLASHQHSAHTATYGSIVSHGAMPYFPSSYDHYSTTNPNNLHRSAYAPLYSHSAVSTTSISSVSAQDDPNQHSASTSASPSTGMFSGSMYYNLPSTQGPTNPYGVHTSAYASIPLRSMSNTNTASAAPLGGIMNQQTLYHPSTPASIQTNSSGSAGSSNPTTAATTPSIGSAPSKLSPGQTTPSLPMQMAQNAAPGPIPATTPLVVRQDQNGVQWIAFEYSRDRVKMEYTIRCDVESVNVDGLNATFKTENCVYPRACVPKEQYKGNRLHYETECNTVGWALADLNPVLRGKRGLIQRAVDSWRNSNQDPRLRSRRVRRMAKNLQRQSENRKLQEQHHHRQQQVAAALPAGISHGHHHSQAPGSENSIGGGHGGGAAGQHRMQPPMSSAGSIQTMGVFPQSYGQSGSAYSMPGLGISASSAGGHQQQPTGSGSGSSVSSSGRNMSASGMSSFTGAMPIPLPPRHGVESGMFTRA